jgi:hypothetical protein
MVTRAGSGSVSTFASRAAIAGGAGAGRGDDEQLLAGVEDLVLGEEPVVVEDRADIVLAGYVGGREDGDHAGCGADGGQIEAGEPRVAVGGEAEGEWSVPGPSGRSST